MAVILLIRFSFQKNFDQYLQARQIEQLQPLAKALAKEYELEHTDWSFLRHNPKRFHEIATNIPEFKYLLLQLAPHILAEQAAHPRNPPRHQHSAQKSAAYKNNPLIIATQRYISIHDEDKNILLGPKRKLTLLNLIPIQLNEQTVGYIAVPKISKMYHKSVMSFLQRQNTTMFYTLVLAIVLALIFSWLLTRQFLGPIKLLTHHSKQLMSRNYHHRIQQFSHDELGTLSKELNSLAMALQQNETVRQKWIADISHELRTPLAVLQGEIEAMLDGIRAINPDSIISLQEETKQLARLVNDLYELSLSDIGALNYQKENISLYCTLHDTLDNFATVFDQEDFSLQFIEPNETDKNVLIFADYDRIKQLITNILKNSIKYTDKPGIIRIQLSKVGQSMQLDIEDSSPALSEHSYPHIFDRLYREESSRNRKTGGAGLGLAICKNIVDAHDATIKAQASDLGGLWLQIKFPLA